jgi:DNA-binding winged helix-turn-helix (wHTH) protein
MFQVVDCLPIKHKGLNSNSSYFHTCTHTHTHTHIQVEKENNKIKFEASLGYIVRFCLQKKGREVEKEKLYSFTWSGFR